MLGETEASTDWSNIDSWFEDIDKSGSFMLWDKDKSKFINEKFEWHLSSIVNHVRLSYLTYQTIIATRTKLEFLGGYDSI